MPRSEPASPLARVFDAASQKDLEAPFRSSSELRRRHFPGAGRRISRSRLLQAYLAEREASQPDWQLLAHGTWAWVQGHAHDLVRLRDDLRRLHREGGDGSLPAKRRRECVEWFTEVGTAEIQAFLDIYAHAGADFRKAVLKRLDSEPAPEGPPAEAAPMPAQGRPAPSSATGPPFQQPESAADLDPLTRARLALIGAGVCFALSLLPVAVQYIRAPGQSHWIVLSIAGVFGLLAAGTAVDYALKRRASDG